MNASPRLLASASRLLANRAITIASSDKFGRCYCADQAREAYNVIQAGEASSPERDALASVARLARLAFYHLIAISSLEAREGERLARSPRLLADLAFHASEARAWGEALAVAAARLA
jgi:hypothetical protein